ncbi:MAG: hypothetical protein ACFFDN_29150 [Candidatus Hodarchaeota archaeon]
MRDYFRSDTFITTMQDLGFNIRFANIKSLDFYKWKILDRPFGMGLYYMIGANNINWEKLVDEVVEELGDEYDGDDEEGSAKIVASLYKDNGIFFKRCLIKIFFLGIKLKFYNVR